MKNRRNDRDDYGYLEEDGQGTVAMVIGGVVLLIIIVVLCTMIWKLFHTDADVSTKGTDQTQLATVTDTLVGETVDGEEDATSGQDEDGEAAGNDGGPDNAGQDDAGEEDSSAGGIQITFTETDDLVTAKDVTNLRSEPSTDRDNTVVRQLKNGENIKRTGINEDMGWSRLDDNGQVLYAATRLLKKVTDSENGQGSQAQSGQESGGQSNAEQAGSNTVTTSTGRVITFTDCDDTISPKIAANLRGEPSSDQGNASIHHQLQYGETAHRTGYDEASGWSRVEYNGEVLYVVTSLIYVVEETEN